MRYLWLLLFALLPAEAFACSCRDGTDSIKEFLKGKTVFTGTAVDSRIVDVADWSQIYRRMTMTTFADLDVLVGETAPTISVHHGTFEASCGLEFEIGAEHYVVAYKSEGTDALVTSICTIGVVDMSDIKSYLATGIDRAVLGRDICYMHIKHAYDKKALLGKFDLAEPKCAAFISDYDRVYRLPQDD